MRVAVLGGLGLMAEAALHDLARQQAVTEVVAADRFTARKAAVLARIPGRRKVRVVALDLEDTARSVRALRGARVLVNAAWYELNLKAMDLALALKAHYVDLGGLYHMTKKQLRRAEEFRRAELLGVLGCGTTPGIANLMAAGMAEAFDAIDTVGIYDASHEPALAGEGFLPPFSIRTMLDEYEMKAPVLEGGRLVMAPPHSRPEELEFKPPIGKCTAGAVIHSELATLPAFLKPWGVRNLAFKIVYPDKVKRQLELLVSMGFARKTPVRVNGADTSPRNFVTALAQQGAVAQSGEPRDFEVLRVRMSGSAGGRPLVLEWDCEIRASKVLSAGAMGVGFTAAIVAGMILSGGTTRRSGVFGPEGCLEWGRFHTELAARKAFRLVERTEHPLSAARSIEGRAG